MYLKLSMRITRKRTIDNDNIAIDRENIATTSAKSDLNLEDLEQVFDCI